MKKEVIEKNAIVLLFILVIATFSFAQRDSKKLYLLYSKSVTDKPAHLPSINQAIYTKS